MEDLYASEPLMLAADRDILSTPLYLRRWQFTQQLQTFVKWAKPLIAESCRQAARLDLGTNFKPIDAYFPREVPTRLWDAILGRPDGAS